MGRGSELPVDGIVFYKSSVAEVSSLQAALAAILVELFPRELLLSEAAGSACVLENAREHCIYCYILERATWFIGQKNVEGG
jgi:hypothetical protein